MMKKHASIYILVFIAAAHAKPSGIISETILDQTGSTLFGASIYSTKTGSMTNDNSCVRILYLPTSSGTASPISYVSSTLLHEIFDDTFYKSLTPSAKANDLIYARGFMESEDASITEHTIKIAHPKSIAGTTVFASLIFNS